MRAIAHACVLEITLREFEEHLYDEERAVATVKRYIHDVAHFLSFLGARGTAEKDQMADAHLTECSSSRENTNGTFPRYSLFKSDTIAFKDYLVNHYSVRTVNTMLSSVNRYLDLCGASAMKVKQVRVQNAHFQDRDRNLDVKEYHRLITSARRKNAGLAIGMETLAMTGVRISELAFFTVSAVKKGRIDITNKGKRRIILIPDALRRKLLVFASAKGLKSGCIFVTKGGKCKDRSNFWREMKALGAESLVQPAKIFPHNLRHLFARMYYRKTRDLPGLADVLGHSSLNVTRIYTSEPEYAILMRMDQVIFALALPEKTGSLERDQAGKKAVIKMKTNKKQHN